MARSTPSTSNPALVATGHTNAANRCFTFNDGQDPMLGSAWNGVGKKAAGFAKNVSLWDPEADRFRKTVLFAGLLAGLRDLLVACFGAVAPGRSGWIGFSALGVSILAREDRNTKPNRRTEGVRQSRARTQAHW